MPSHSGLVWPSFRWWGPYLVQGAAALCRLLDSLDQKSTSQQTAVRPSCANHLGFGGIWGRRVRTRLLSPSRPVTSRTYPVSAGYPCEAYLSTNPRHSGCRQAGHMYAGKWTRARENNKIITKHLLLPLILKPTSLFPLTKKNNGASLFRSHRRARQQPDGLSGSELISNTRSAGGYIFF